MLDVSKSVEGVLLSSCVNLHRDFGFTVTYNVVILLEIGGVGSEVSEFRLENHHCRVGE